MLTMIIVITLPQNMVEIPCHKTISYFIKYPSFHICWGGFHLKTTNPSGFLRAQDFFLLDDHHHLLLFKKPKRGGHRKVVIHSFYWTSIQQGFCTELRLFNNFSIYPFPSMPWAGSGKALCHGDGCLSVRRLNLAGHLSTLSYCFLKPIWYLYIEKMGGAINATEFILPFLLTIRPVPTNADQHIKEYNWQNGGSHQCNWIHFAISFDD